MNSVKAVAGATIGAAIGALIWGMVAKFTGYELGWVAWGVGALAGFGAAFLGGRGQAMAITAAALALGGIFVGKVYAVELGFEDELQKEAGTYFSTTLYQELIEEGRSIGATDPSQYRQFMIDHDYTDAESAGQISDEELDWFSQEQVPQMIDFAADPPDFEAWKSERTDEWIGAVRQDVSFISVVLENLGPFDALWAILGLMTAYRVVLQHEDGDEESEEPAPPGTDV